MTPPAAIGEVVGGRYRVDALIGKGGMGAVYRATHTTLEQPVALKLMLDGAIDPESRARFFREAKVIASLKNDHVVRVLDAGEHGEGLYIAMELLEGTDLGTLAQGPMDIPTAIGWVLQACTCLEEAHARGIIHRDLKPANLFLTRRPDGTPCLKVLDFGISKADDQGDADTQLTGAGELLGSPHYMSPEQVAAPRTVDERTDVWALGILLYRLISGRVPFEGEQIAVVFAKLHRENPPPLPDVPPALMRVIDKCLCKEREGRFATVMDLRVALLPFVNGGEDAPTVARSREEPMPVWDDQTATKVAPNPAGSRNSPKVQPSAAPVPAAGVPARRPPSAPPASSAPRHSPGMMSATPPMSYPPPANPLGAPRASYAALPPHPTNAQPLPPPPNPRASLSGAPSPGPMAAMGLAPAGKDPASSVSGVNWGAQPQPAPRSSFGLVAAVAFLLATAGVALLAFAKWRADQHPSATDEPPPAVTSAIPTGSVRR